MRADTLRWLAEQTERTVEEVERDLKQFCAGAPSNGRPAPEGTAVDLHRALREMPPHGDGAGVVQRFGRARLTLVVALPRVRVWVARGDEWDRVERRGVSDEGCPVRYQVFGTSQKEPEPRWHDVQPSDVPAALDEQVGRAVWASRVQGRAA